MVQGTKSIILNNSYKIYHVKLPRFWFWQDFVPYTTRFWKSGYHLGVPLAIVSWKITVWKKLLLLLKSYKTLFKSKWMWSCVCLIHNMTVKLWRRVLSRDSLPIIAYVPPNWSIKLKCFSSRQICCMSNY